MPYLVEVARDRIAQIGPYLYLAARDATAGLGGTYGRIVSMVGVSHIPAPWARAPRPGGRLVTAPDGVWVTITATRHDDGYAYGRVE